MVPRDSDYGYYNGYYIKLLPKHGDRRARRCRQRIIWHHWRVITIGSGYTVLCHALSNNSFVFICACFWMCEDTQTGAIKCMNSVTLKIYETYIWKACVCVGRCVKRSWTATWGAVALQLHGSYQANTETVKHGTCSVAWVLWFEWACLAFSSQLAWAALGKLFAVYSELSLARPHLIFWITSTPCEGRVPQVESRLTQAWCA